jgi:hypothetical protein
MQLRKTILLVFLSLLIGYNSYSQTDNNDCFYLRVLNRKFLKDSLLLRPQNYLQGFCVLTNGVYDLGINDKKYLYHRILKITSDSIYSCYVFDTVTTLKFSIHDDIIIYLSQRKDGATGLSRYSKRKRQDYEFKIIPSKKKCFLQTAKVCSNKNCDQQFDAYQYLTAFKDFFPIYQENEQDFVIEGSSIEKIKKED